LQDVDRVLRNLEKNPQSLIWGNPAPLPEYKGH
jgi:hypothetical protein